ncbi:hypothetical protein [Streptomyces sp. NPDC026673]|uniref:hypothetical protein n=1 Tax=Streptomyces sp. NPDC026673 TaxID=3155724 RepID=UPI0034038687
MAPLTAGQRTHYGDDLFMVYGMVLALTTPHRLTLPMFPAQLGLPSATNAAPNDFTGF